MKYKMDRNLSYAIEFTESIREGDQIISEMLPLRQLHPG